MVEKTITIDWDNFDQVSKLYAQVKNRKIQLDPNHIKKHDRKKIFKGYVRLLF